MNVTPPFRTCWLRGLVHGFVCALLVSGHGSAAADRSFHFDESISREAYPNTGYDQPLRPQFHFTSRRNWHNDPNGLVYDGKQYHMFFQHNPKGTSWGNMTWGHATSPDMVHWTQLDHALLPYYVDGHRGTIFSGTAVVDRNNSLGVQRDDVPTLAAFFTCAREPRNTERFYQAMAYSTDRGRTWTYYDDGYPVVPNQGFDRGERDPKVGWWQPGPGREDEGHWIMVLWVQRASKDRPNGTVRFFRSNDLKHWTFASDLKRPWVYECMGFVHLPLDGNPNDKRWVIFDASFDYEIGAFDGEKFESDGRAFKQQHGNYYAAQTFNDSPDGRTVIIGWMNGGPNSAKEYGLPFNQQMSFPSEMTLRTTPEGPRIFLWPIEEINTLVTNAHQWSELSLVEANRELAGIPPLDLADIELDFTPGAAKEIRFDLQDVSLRYNGERHWLECRQPGGRDSEGTRKPDRWAGLCGPLPPRDGRVQLRLLIDRLSVEAFGFGGEVTGTMYYDPRIGPGRQAIEASGDDVTLSKLTIRELTSIWP